MIKKNKNRTVWHSFKHAFDGLFSLFKSERNAKIHIFLAIFAILMGIVLSISSMEWIAIIICISGVLALELINSSIEELSDFVSPDYAIQIKKVKDFAAAAVLIFAIGALITGLIVFAPKLVNFVL